MMTQPGYAETLETTDVLPETLPGAPQPTPISVLPKARPDTGPGPLTTLPRVVERQPTLRIDPRPRSRYVVEEALGTGGMGEVLLAEDRDIERRVAMKQIRPGVATEAHLAASFADEVRALGRLEHPNIVPLYDVGRDVEGRLYFTMKYVRGQTVADLITQLEAGDPEVLAAWPLARRVDIFAGVLEALSYAHGQGVLHLDVKPENVMIGPHGEVLLMDWGIASFDHETKAGRVAGSLGYMSPEQARGMKLDERSDLFSAFVLFFELLTLRPYIPRVDSLPAMLLETQMKQPPARLGPAWIHPHQHPVPMEYRHFIVKGLRNDREERLPSAAEALRRLGKIRSGDFDASCPITMTKRMQIATARLIEGQQWIMPAIVFGTPLAGLTYLLWKVFGQS